MAQDGWAGWSKESKDWKDDQRWSASTWQESADTKAAEWPADSWQKDAKAEEWSADTWKDSSWTASGTAEPANSWDAAADATQAPAWPSNEAEEKPWASSVTTAQDAAVDPWAAASKKQDSWSGYKADSGNGAGSWDQGDSWKAPAPTGKPFWEEQEWNKSTGALSRKEDWEHDQEEATIFTQSNHEGIDFNLYDSVPVDISGNKATLIPVFQTFEELFEEFGEIIPKELIRNVDKCGYRRPTPVQKFSIPAGMVGRDVMVCAQTGSGKTAAFLVPVIGRMMTGLLEPCGTLTVPFEGKCRPHTLILAPTRELVLQIYDESVKMCHRTAYRCCRVYGGEPPKVQMAHIAKGADLLVAAPGRLQDFINRDIIAVDSVGIMVLDEADRMLDMGFEPQIRAIVENHGMAKSDKRQTMMFSATFAEECQRMAQDFLYDYIWIGVGIVGGAVESVTQSLVQVAPAEKYAMLVQVLDEFFAKRPNRERVLVFCNAKDTARFLDEQLYEKYIDSGSLHGDLTQTERERNLARFRAGEIEVMVATDVASRGLDIAQVDTVVNYDLPNDIDTYVHRIGRTGRIGNRGKAVSFIAVDDAGNCIENTDLLKNLEKILRDSKSDVPAWLRQNVEAGGSWNSWNDNWKDARRSWGGEETTGSSWDNWTATHTQ
eukprot:CAMPEP_0170587722 /NCGR_PEP_ID=MMETSP0224-20130122/10436_1 /TAXON_ID=285029 /ORGANISM="Togula jolla, Strain CCCM 725" /LENGTH=659 /DNA_ID=CAMNT_0010911367 /DNA_START=1 /DNA_END=1980 /DNA_ORIENTATION=+